MTYDEQRRCLIAAHAIRLEAERLIYSFTLSTTATPLTKDIGLALEIIDTRIAYLTHIMATHPLPPPGTCPTTKGA